MDPEKDEILHGIYSQEKLMGGFQQRGGKGGKQDAGKIPFSQVKESLILKEFITVLKDLNQSIPDKRRPFSIFGGKQ